MKEVEHRGKGLQHDLSKLQSLHGRLSKPVETWLVCVDLAPLGIAFDAHDLEKYAKWSTDGGAKFAYISQKEVLYRVNAEGLWSLQEPKSLPCAAHTNPWDVLQQDSVWNEFALELARDQQGVECCHVGLLYHTLRSAGLLHNQVASEVFFNCNRYGARNYYRPDAAVLDGRFRGQFQLYGNKHKTVENDHFKLPLLASIIEFKGGRSFCKNPLSWRISAVAKDLEKLATEVRPRIETAPAFQARSPELPRPRYIMVVTDSDPLLEPELTHLRSKYEGLVDLRWPRGLVTKPTSHIGEVAIC